MVKGNKNHATKDGEAVVNIHGGRKSIFSANVSDMKYPKSVQQVKSTDGKTNLHPTQKPVALFEYLIRTYSNEGDLVLDSCAGSGTTGIAAINTKRNFILIEKQPEYIAIIKKRLEPLQSIV